MRKDRSYRLPTFGHAKGVDAVAASAWWRQWLALRLRLASFLPLSVRNWRLALRIRRLPDRVYMERELIPTVARLGGKVLFVGCQRYTRHYPALFEVRGTECWTIDIDPTVACWGARRRHVIGALQDACDHWPPASFETIILNGVFGFGLDTERDQDAALRTCNSLLRRGGWLILGRNFDDSSQDPSSFSMPRHDFYPAALPGLAPRQTFRGSTHVYETFVVEADMLPEL